MTDRVQLREHVRRAVSADWPRFERDHPLLAAATDVELLVAGAEASIATDAAFVKALADAHAASGTAEAVAGVVDAAVNRWLRKLI